VERDDWGGGYCPPPPPPRAVGPSLPTRALVPSNSDGSRASLTIPNAACPVCGARVYFYQNEFGSRVFFDDLGPPWPKHPCTDNAPDIIGRESFTKIGTGTGHAGVQVSRSPSPQSALPLFQLTEQIQDYVPSRHTGDGWDRCVVKKRSVRDEKAYFVAVSATRPQSKSIRFSTVSRVDFPRTGETLYLKGDRMSFFSFEKFAPVEVEVHRKISKAVSSVRKRKARRKRRRK